MYSKKLLFVTVATLSLAASAVQASPKDITSKEAFMSAVVGKQLRAKGSELVISSDGKISGSLGGNGISESKWSWEGRKFCRSLATAKKKFPWTCQTVSIDGKTIIFGGKAHWTIN